MWATINSRNTYSSAQRSYRENTPTHIQKKRKLSSSSRQAGTYVYVHSCVAMWNSPKLFLLTGVKSLLTQPRNLHSIYVYTCLFRLYSRGRAYTILYMLSALLSSWVSTELTRRVTFNSHKKRTHTHTHQAYYISIYIYIYLISRKELGA